MMNSYICNLKASSKPELSEVGGKAANLMKLEHMENITIPKGFCIKTNAFAEIVLSNSDLNALISDLSSVRSNEIDNLMKLSESIRAIIENLVIPEHIGDEIKFYLEQVGIEKSYAVRSSATAEDLPNASFAGQYDTFLNIVGQDSILNHIKLCWASLFTDRAISYRIQNNIEHRTVGIAVVVQEMIASKAAGVMFTADPKTSNRKVVSIDASYGIGESLVSGIVNVDNYKVREGIISHKRIPDKVKRLDPLPNGGLMEKSVDEHDRKSQTINDDVILELERIGRRIEDYFSCPQDIEWCLENGKIYILQSRPITTLYPLPEAEDGGTHVFLSTGHLQMMTAPIKPLGISFFKMALGDAPYQVIGGRLYNDITHDLATSTGRLMAKNLLKAIGDQLMTDAVEKVIDNKTLIKQLPKGKNKTFKSDKMVNPISVIVNMIKQYKKNDPNLVQKLIDREEASIDKMREEIKDLTGTALMDFIYEDHKDRRFKIIHPDNAAVLAVAMIASLWLNRTIQKNLGIENASDTILTSISNSITTDTGLALLDLSDLVRKHPHVMAYFEDPRPSSFYEDLKSIDGGQAVTIAFKKYLDLYGMRCSGDIDITVSRWSEDPTGLIPIILNNIRNFEPNAKDRIIELGVKEYEDKLNMWTADLEMKFAGKRKAKRVRKNAEVMRNYIGYREYPKFSYMKRYLIYKRAMLKEAELLVVEGIFKEKEDIFFISLEELMDVIKTRSFDNSLVKVRKNDYKFFERLTPQRIITSDGDVISGAYDKVGHPSGSLPGVGVSAGVVEGRARVIQNMDEADFEDGDILVTMFTDPSWTPVFVSIKGLVTEVGGLSTHGAVISREYGLPAVVSVEDATKKIKDGQRIRLNGSKGYVEVLE